MVTAPLGRVRAFPGDRPRRNARGLRPIAPIPIPIPIPDARAPLTENFCSNYKDMFLRAKRGAHREMDDEGKMASTNDIADDNGGDD